MPIEFMGSPFLHFPMLMPLTAILPGFPSTNQTDFVPKHLPAFEMRSWVDVLWIVSTCGKLIPRIRGQSAPLKSINKALLHPPLSHVLITNNLEFEISQSNLSKLHKIHSQLGKYRHVSLTPTAVTFRSIQNLTMKLSATVVGLLAALAMAAPAFETAEALEAQTEAVVNELVSRQIWQMLEANPKFHFEGRVSVTCASIGLLSGKEPA
ncbi:uncharacterized protein CLUP02_06695 [Colletotrichum lupini]|uniref:Uncharacterized protein n=1 Tax=Colletotrichum lupini TaxID=145971 RepID=A0A9Q8SPK9_9PEZI|nr:uncharacterized protein CLUP02_06695 [Colletotrichum lupini]UQC81209.1 hypothetical protein CLUP02_06695 [Colletotrichum lupini]